MGGRLVLLFLGTVYFGFPETAYPLPDVNECENAATCPKRSTCTNSIGSYYCSCKLGFRVKSGEVHFTDSSLSCDDIDECAENSAVCGPHTICINRNGGYDCRCSEGFFSREGRVWIKGRSKCEDVNECRKVSACPDHSECLNTIGSFFCTCDAGFKWTNSTGGAQCAAEPTKTESPITSFTTVTSQSMRISTPTYATEPTATESPFTTFTTVTSERSSTGTPTSTTAEPTTAESPITSFTTVTSQSMSISTPTYATEPTATESPFTTFTTVTSERSSTGTPTSTTEITLNCDNEKIAMCKNQSNQDPACSLLLSTYSVIRGLCETRNATIALQNVTEGFSQVLKQTSSLSNLSRTAVATVATNLLATIETTILASFSRPGSNGSQRITTGQLDVQTEVITDDCIEKDTLFHLNAKGDRMDISCSTITRSSAEASTGVAFISFKEMDLLLNGSYFKDQDETLRDIQINSRVVSGQITSEKRSGFLHPVIFILQHLKEKDSAQQVICVFWNATKGGGSWSRQGCKHHSSNRTHTECGCYHLSSFAVIMAVAETPEDFSLTVVTYLGVTFSLLCLSLAILTFLFCRCSRNTNTAIHLQLCVCLFLAELLLLTGLKRTSNKIGCAIIAGLLHYLFLACFSWMFVEALMLFLTVRNLNVVNYFNTRKIKTLHLSLFAYGFPTIIIVITAASSPGSYGTDKNCWLDFRTGLVWSFLGPVCAFLLINSCLFAATLCILRRQLSSVDANVSSLKDTRLLTFKASAQLFVLGCPWIIGIFQIGSVALFMAYLFTIVNSLQGPFILLIHCILNRQVRKEYMKCFTQIHKPSSASQSSGLTMSTAAVPMQPVKDGNDFTTKAAAQPVSTSEKHQPHSGQLIKDGVTCSGQSQSLSSSTDPL
ncbi:adhesion G protein-coupled receptor E1-like isoform X1 [Ambystoma mexicanum]|uniref:adhesion G protein-coupled receptor E1-like isoform X1 n=1 Tax=Ambystoma mexicanum TaxID=8296 RepID=UPI0037E84EE4